MRQNYEHDITNASIFRIIVADFTRISSATGSAALSKSEGSGFDSQGACQGRRGFESRTGLELPVRLVARIPCPGQWPKWLRPWSAKPGIKVRLLVVPRLGGQAGMNRLGEKSPNFFYLFVALLCKCLYVCGINPSTCQE